MASLVLNGNTSGSITISSPAVSGSNTLTLPTQTGTVIASDSSGNVFIGGTTQNTSTKPVYSSTTAKAWVVFNGSTTITVYSSFNVSSVTRTSAGLYVINFTNAMVDNVYGTQMSASTSVNNLSVSNNINYGASQTTSATTVAHLENSTLTDSSFVCVSIFR